LNDVPDNPLVNAKILMSQNVFQSSNFLPFNSGNGQLYFIGQVACSLPDDFKVADNRIKGFLVSSKCFVIQFINIGKN
jgi:hypothetical protein